jgi:hypothetical protein
MRWRSRKSDAARPDREPSGSPKPTGKQAMPIIVPAGLFFQVQVANRPLKGGYRPPNGKRVRRRLWGKLRRETYLRVMPKQMKRGGVIKTRDVICQRQIPLN